MARWLAAGYECGKDFIADVAWRRTDHANICDCGEKIVGERQMCGKIMCQLKRVCRYSLRSLW